MEISELYQLYLQHPSVQTDTRKLREGDIFVALHGPNFNGNLFAGKALEAGASYVVVDEDLPGADERYIRVADGLTTLQALAKHHREQFTIPFIGITGSNGKTTTKELIYAVLSTHYRTYTTQGNLNNHIGVPLTILSIRPDAEMAVIEMGANHQNEIAGYCVYAQPTHGLITNCGKAHLEGFGSIEGVRKAKGELFDYLRNHKGTAFIFAEYDYLQTMSADIAQVIRYGQKEGLITGHIQSNEPFLQVRVDKGFDTALTIQTQLVGDYNLPNILSAVVIGKYFSVPENKIREALGNYTPSNSRSQLIQKDTNTIILDAYNANPSSMKAAIENFANLQAPKKILLLGAMMEMGDASLEEHKSLVAFISQYTWDQVVLVGGDFGKIPHPYLFFNNSGEAKEWFQRQSINHTYILIKGSRSMQMERILE